MTIAWRVVSWAAGATGIGLMLWIVAAVFAGAPGSTLAHPAAPAAAAPGASINRSVMLVAKESDKSEKRSEESPRSEKSSRSEKPSKSEKPKKPKSRDKVDKPGRDRADRNGGRISLFSWSHDSAERGRDADRGRDRGRDADSSVTDRTAKQAVTDPTATAKKAAKDPSDSATNTVAKRVANRGQGADTADSSDDRRVTQAGFNTGRDASSTADKSTSTKRVIDSVSNTVRDSVEARFASFGDRHSERDTDSSTGDQVRQAVLRDIRSAAAGDKPTKGISATEKAVRAAVSKDLGNRGVDREKLIKNALNAAEKAGSDASKIAGKSLREALDATGDTGAVRKAILSDVRAGLNGKVPANGASATETAIRAAVNSRLSGAKPSDSLDRAVRRAILFDVRSALASKQPAKGASVTEKAIRQALSERLAAAAQGAGREGLIREALANAGQTGSTIGQSVRGVLSTGLPTHLGSGLGASSKEAAASRAAVLSEVRGALARKVPAQRGNATEAAIRQALDAAGADGKLDKTVTQTMRAALAGRQSGDGGLGGLLDIPRTVLRELGKAGLSDGTDGVDGIEDSLGQAVLSRLPGQSAQGVTGAGLSELPANRQQGQQLHAQMQKLVTDKLAKVGVSVDDLKGLSEDEVREQLSAAGVSEKQLRRMVESRLRDQLGDTDLGVEQNQLAGLSDKQLSKLANAGLLDSDLTGLASDGLAAARKAAANAGVDPDDLGRGRLEERLASGRGAQQLVSGAVDLASNIAAAVGGEKLGKTVRGSLSGIGELVSNAIVVAMKARGNGKTGDGLNGLLPDQGLTPGRGDGSILSDGTGGSIKALAARIVREALSGRTGDGLTEQAEGITTADWSGLGSRGPPSPLSDETDNRSRSQKATDEVFNGRLAVKRGQQELSKAKSDLAAGKIDQATYDGKVAAQKDLETKTNNAAAQLSDERNALINDAISGHEKLAADQSKLDAQKKQVADGKLDQATYDANAAAFEAERERVYAQTDELRAATGRDAVRQADAGRDGAGASCGSSGAFGECSTAAVDKATGESSEDRSVCLTGVSGCSSSSSSGDRAASASCTTDGCATSTKAGEKTASAKCGAGDCNTAAVADSRGADAVCQAKNGCESTSNTPTKPDVADLAAGKTEGKAEGTGSCTRDCALATSASKSEASSDCRSDNGACDTSSTGKRASEDAPAAQGTDAQAAAMSAEEKAKANGEASSKAHCQSSAGGCDTTASVRLARTDEGRRGWFDSADYQTSDGSPKASAGAHCASAATDCSGNAEATTGGKTTRSTTTPGTPAAVVADPATGQEAVAATPAKTNTTELAHSGTATCQVTSGGCDTTSGGDETSGAQSQARLDCETATCTGKGANTTSASITATTDGKTATRTTTGGSNCEATAGGCQSNATSVTGADVRSDVSRGWLGTQAQTADQTTNAGPELTADSTASTTVDCQAAKCTGTGNSATTGEASGDIKGVRDSKSNASCEAHGAGGACNANSDTEVADRDAELDVKGKPVPGSVSGPVSVSTADAKVQCSHSDACGGKGYSETFAGDTGLSPHRRGSSASTDCSVTGGGCSGETSSKASSTADFTETDPATGKPVAGAPTSGSTSVSTSSASVDCHTATCSGKAATSAASWDGAIEGGKPRSSNGIANCEAGGGACQMQSKSAASTSPGAARNFAAEGQAPNAARLPAGPSSASVAGAALNCNGTATCNGKVASAATATATDPSVSPDPRGSHSEGSCENATDPCQAVSNSGASSGPDANSMAPLVQAKSTENATVTQGTTGEQQQGQDQGGQPGQDQPATPPAPAAPGSSANSDGPTVPGASSWTMAFATLDCADGESGCSGATRTSAAGSDGPNNVNGANGARGPPEGKTTTSASCTSGQSACQATSESNAAAGQVVADILTEQNKQAAETAAKPVTDAPATLAQSQAAGQCAGAGCTARTTGESAISGQASTRSRTEATCRAGAGGCTAASGSQVTTDPHSGVPRSDTPGATMLHGRSGTAQTSSRIDCPDADCAGTVTGDSTATPGATAAPAGAGGAPTNGESPTPITRTTATGQTRCPGGNTACRASLMIGTAVATFPGSGPEHFGRHGNVVTEVVADCQSAAGACPTRTSTSTVATDDPATLGPAGIAGNHTARATGTARCEGAQTCRSATSGVAADHAVEVTANCAGTGCSTETAGTVRYSGPVGSHEATSTAHCIAGAGGGCAGGSRVGATAEVAEAAATCQTTAGGRCGYSFGARSHAEAAGPGQQASSDAHGSAHGTVGSGEVTTFAQAAVTANSAQASAGCFGLASCQRSYRAYSEASASYAGMTATGYADESDSRPGEGSGGVATVAGAIAGPDGAYAFGFCSGSPGAACKQSGEVFVAPPSPPPVHVGVGGDEGSGGVAEEETGPELDPETRRKAEQNGRDQAAGVRVESTGATDNHVARAYQHAANAENRLNAETDQAGDTAYQDARDAGATHAEANAQRAHARAEYADAAAAKATHMGRTPAAITRAKGGAMADLKAAVEHRQRLGQLRATAAQATKDANSSLMAAGRDLPDNKLAPVVARADAKAAASMRAASGLADEAAGIARDNSIRHGASPSVAADQADQIRAEYTDYVVGIPSRVRDYWAASDVVMSSLPAAARDQRAPRRVTDLGATDKDIAAAYRHRQNSKPLAAGAEAVGDMGALHVQMFGVDAKGRPLSGMLGATPEEAEQARKNATYDYYESVGAEMTKPGPGSKKTRPLPGYITAEQETNTPSGKLAQVLRIEKTQADVKRSIPSVAGTVWQGAGIRDVPDNQLERIVDSGAPVRNAVGDAVAAVEDAAYQESLLRGKSPEQAEMDRVRAGNDYRAKLGVEIGRKAKDMGREGDAPDYVLEAASGGGTVTPEMQAVFDHRALADGRVSADEQAAVAEAYDRALASQPKLDPLGELAPYVPYDPAKRETNNRLDAVSDPKVVEAIVPERDVNEAGFVVTRPRTAADELRNAELGLAAARARQQAIDTDVSQYDDYVARHNAEVAAINRRGGATRAEALAMNIEQQRIEAEYARLNGELVAARHAVDQQTDALIPVDIAIADASGNHAAAAQLRAAQHNLAKARTIRGQLPSTANGTPRDLGALANQGYADVRDSMATIRAVDGMQLPSGGTPGAGLALNAANRLPTFSERINADPVRGQFDDLGVHEQARLASYKSAAEFERDRIGNGDRLVDMYFPAKPGETVEERAARYDQFMELVENGQVEDLEDMTQFLPDSERDRIMDAAPDGVEESYFDIGESVASAFREGGDGVERSFEAIGLGGTTAEVAGNAWEDAGTIVGYAPVGFYRIGEWIRQSGANRIGMVQQQVIGRALDPIVTARIAPQPGDTWDKAYTRRDPLLGNMFVTPTANTARRWGPAAFFSDFSKVVNGDAKTGLMGYKKNPLLSAAEDMVPFMVVGGGVSMGFRLAATGAVSAARAATRNASIAAALANRASRLADLGFRKATTSSGPVVNLIEHKADLAFRAQHLEQVANIRVRRATNLHRISVFSGASTRPTELVRLGAKPVARGFGEMLTSSGAEAALHAPKTQLPAHITLQPRSGAWRLNLGQNLISIGEHGLSQWARNKWGGPAGNPPVGPVKIHPDLDLNGLLTCENDCVRAAVAAADQRRSEFGLPSRPLPVVLLDPDRPGEEHITALEAYIGSPVQATSHGAMAARANTIENGWYLVWSRGGPGQRDHLFLAVYQEHKLRYYETPIELIDDKATGPRYGVLLQEIPSTDPQVRQIVAAQAIDGGPLDYSARRHFVQPVTYHELLAMNGKIDRGTFIVWTRGGPGEPTRSLSVGVHKGQLHAVIEGNYRELTASDPLVRGIFAVQQNDSGEPVVLSPRLSPGGADLTSIVKELSAGRYLVWSRSGPNGRDRLLSAVVGDADVRYFDEHGVELSSGAGEIVAVTRVDGNTAAGPRLADQKFLVWPGNGTGAPDRPLIAVIENGEMRYFDEHGEPVVGGRQVVDPSAIAPLTRPVAYKQFGARYVARAGERWLPIQGQATDHKKLDHWFRELIEKRDRDRARAGPGDVLDRGIPGSGEQPPSGPFAPGAPGAPPAVPPPGAVSPVSPRVGAGKAKDPVHGQAATGPEPAPRHVEHDGPTPETSGHSSEDQLAPHWGTGVPPPSEPESIPRLSQRLDAMHTEIADLRGAQLREVEAKQRPLKAEAEAIERAVRGEQNRNLDRWFATQVERHRARVEGDGYTPGGLQVLREGVDTTTMRQRRQRLEELRGELRANEAGAHRIETRIEELQRAVAEAEQLLGQLHAYGAKSDAVAHVPGSYGHQRRVLPEPPNEFDPLGRPSDNETDGWTPRKDPEPVESTSARITPIDAYAADNQGILAWRAKEALTKLVLPPALAIARILSPMDPGLDPPTPHVKVVGHQDAEPSVPAHPVPGSGFDPTEQPFWQWRNRVKLQPTIGDWDPWAVEGRVNVDLSRHDSALEAPPGVDGSVWSAMLPAQRAAAWERFKDDVTASAEHAEARMLDGRDRFREFADLASPLRHNAAAAATHAQAHRAIAELTWRGRRALGNEVSDAELDRYARYLAGAATAGLVLVGGLGGAATALGGVPALAITAGAVTVAAALTAAVEGFRGSQTARGPSSYWLPLLVTIWPAWATGLATDGFEVADLFTTGLVAAGAQLGTQVARAALERRHRGQTGSAARRAEPGDARPDRGREESLSTEPSVAVRTERRPTAPLSAARYWWASSYRNGHSAHGIVVTFERALRSYQRDLDALSGDAASRIEQLAIRWGGEFELDEILADLDSRRQELAELGESAVEVAEPAEAAEPGPVTAGTRTPWVNRRKVEGPTRVYSDTIKPAGRVNLELRTDTPRWVSRILGRWLGRMTTLLALPAALGLGTSNRAAASPGVDVARVGLGADTTSSSWLVPVVVGVGAVGAGYAVLRAWRAQKATADDTPIEFASGGLSGRVEGLPEQIRSPATLEALIDELAAAYSLTPDAKHVLRLLSADRPPSQSAEEQGKAATSAKKRAAVDLARAQRMDVELGLDPAYVEHRLLVARIVQHLVRVVNPGRNDDERRDINCYACAVASDLTVIGYPATAMPGVAANDDTDVDNFTRVKLAELEGRYGRSFRSVNDEAEVRRLMLAAGTGARGIVRALAHVFNVFAVRAVLDGRPEVVVVFTDGQFGGRPNPKKYLDEITGFLRVDDLGGPDVAGVRSELVSDGGVLVEHPTAVHDIGPETGQITVSHNPNRPRRVLTPVSPASVGRDGAGVTRAIRAVRPGMVVTVLGASGSAPVDRDGALVGTSSYLVQTPGAQVLLDAGVGSAAALGRLEGRLDGVLVTHRHDDHFADLYELALQARASGRTLPVFGPGELLTELTRRLDNETVPGFDVTIGDPVGGKATTIHRDRAGTLYIFGDRHVVVGAGVEVDAWLGGLGLRDRVAAIVVPTLRDADVAGLLFLGQNRLYPKNRTGGADREAAEAAARNPIPVYGPRGLGEEIRARSHGRGYPREIDEAFEFHTFGSAFPIGAEAEIAGLPITISERPNQSTPAAGAGELFDFTELAADREIPVGDVGVTPFAVDHLGQDAYGFRVRGPPGTGTLVYSGDTGGTRALVAAARQADLGLFNAFSLASSELEGLHMSGRSAAGIAGEAGVRQLALVHHHWNADADAILAEARAAFRRPVWSARAGDQYWIGRPPHLLCEGRPWRGGDLALDEELLDNQRERLDELVPDLYSGGRELTRAERTLARGPPSTERIRVVHGAQLRAMGVPAAVSARLVAYGKPDQNGGVIVLVAEQLDAARMLIALGFLDASWLAAVLDYERTFRLVPGADEAARRAAARSLRNGYQVALAAAPEDLRAAYGRRTRGLFCNTADDRVIGEALDAATSHLGRTRPLDETERTRLAGWGGDLDLVRVLPWDLTDAVPALEPVIGVVVARLRDLIRWTVLLVNAVQELGRTGQLTFSDGPARELRDEQERASDLADVFERFRSERDQLGSEAVALPTEAGWIHHDVRLRRDRLEIIIEALTALQRLEDEPGEDIRALRIRLVGIPRARWSADQLSTIDGGLRRLAELELEDMFSGDSAPSAHRVIGEIEFLVGELNHMIDGADPGTGHTDGGPNALVSGATVVGSLVLGLSMLGYPTTAAIVTVVGALGVVFPSGLGTRQHEVRRANAAPSRASTRVLMRVSVVFTVVVALLFGASGVAWADGAAAQVATGTSDGWVDLGLYALAAVGVAVLQRLAWVAWTWRNRHLSGDEFMVVTGHDHDQHSAELLRAARTLGYRLSGRGGGVGGVTAIVGVAGLSAAALLLGSGPARADAVSAGTTFERASFDGAPVGAPLSWLDSSWVGYGLVAIVVVVLAVHAWTGGMTIRAPIGRLRTSTWLGQVARTISGIWQAGPHHWTWIALAVGVMALVGMDAVNVLPIAALVGGTALGLVLTGNLLGSLVLGQSWLPLRHRLLAVGVLGVAAGAYTLTGPGPAVVAIAALIVGFTSSLWLRSFDDGVATPLTNKEELGRSATKRRGLAMRFAAWEQGNFRLYASGELVSSMGTWSQRIAQIWLVLEITGGSAMWLGVVSALQFAPTILLTLWAGVYADRVNKRRLLAKTQAGLGLVALTTGIMGLLGMISLPWILAAALLTGVFTAIDAPTRRAFMPELVDEDRLPSALKIDQLITSVTKIAGPAIAGLLLLIIGPATMFLLNAASYGAALRALRSMNPMRLRAAKPAARAKHQIAAGFTYIRGKPDLVRMLTLLTFVSMLGINFPLTLPLLAEGAFDTGPATFGLLTSAYAVGTVLGYAATNPSERYIPRLSTLVGAAVALGVLQAVAGLMPTFVAAAGFLALAGVAVAVWSEFAYLRVQRSITEEDMRARVLSIYVLLNTGTMPASALLIGWLGDNIGARAPTVFAGFATAVTALLFATWWWASGGRSVLRGAARWALRVLLGLGLAVLVMLLLAEFGGAVAESEHPSSAALHAAENGSWPDIGWVGHALGSVAFVLLATQALTSGLWLRTAAHRITGGFSRLVARVKRGMEWVFRVLTVFGTAALSMMLISAFFPSFAVAAVDAVALPPVLPGLAAVGLVVCAVAAGSALLWRVRRPKPAPPPRAVDPIAEVFETLASHHTS